MMKENPKMTDQKAISSDQNIKMEWPSKNFLKNQMDKLPDMLEILRDFRFFTLVEEFGDELTVDTKQEYSN